jgi:hypothetical protein
MRLLLGIIFTLQLALLAATIYVAAHFIVKFW